MPHQMLVGLFVTDEQLYAEYRAAMKPIMKSYDGRFGYDFQVAEVLQSETAEPINRVFTIIFDNDSSKAQFFADPEYLLVKKKYFEPSVSHTTLIAAYDRD